MVTRGSSPRCSLISLPTSMALAAPSATTIMKLVLPPQPGCADLLGHVLFKVILMLRHQHRRGPHGYAHIQGQISGVTAHDLHHGAAFVGLHGVPQTVNALHGGIGGGVEADGIVGADDVVVDGAGHAHHGYAESGQILRPRKVPSPPMATMPSSPSSLQVLAAFFCPSRRAELLAAGGIENGAAPVDDAADAAGIHGTDIPGDKARPAPMRMPTHSMLFFIAVRTTAARMAAFMPGMECRRRWSCNRKFSRSG